MYAGQYPALTMFNMHIIINSPFCRSKSKSSSKTGFSSIAGTLGAATISDVLSF